MTWLSISSAALVGFAFGAAFGYAWGAKRGFEKAVEIGLGLELAAMAVEKARVAHTPTPTAADMALTARTASKIKN